MEGMKSVSLLQTEIKDLFEKEVFGDQIMLKNTSGEMTTITGYEQDLPIRKTDGEESQAASAEEYAPFFLLCVSEIQRENRNDPKSVSFQMFFCIYDNGPENQGHKDILGLIEKATQYLEKYPTLCKACYVPAESSITATLPDDSSWPYFFGGLSFTVQIQNGGVENEYI